MKGTPKLLVPPLLAYYYFATFGTDGDEQKIAQRAKAFVQHFKCS
jgi:hypothetical protein